MPSKALIVLSFSGPDIILNPEPSTLCQAKNTPEELKRRTLAAEAGKGARAIAVQGLWSLGFRLCWWSWGFRVSEGVLQVFVGDFSDSRA